MSFSTFSSFTFVLITFALLLQNVVGVEPLFSLCPTKSENSTVNGSYMRSLNTLLGSFHHLTPVSGFALGSLGQNSQDIPYGLALCRGDVSPWDCKTCVANATMEIRKRCPNNKEAIIGYDNCLLKYSDKDFLGQIDNQTKFYLVNTQNVSNPVAFEQNKTELLSQIATLASATSTLYAAGARDFEGSIKLYGLAQCTRDLSGVDCKKCLDGAIGELLSFSYGRKGGRVVGGSCSVRYEIYPFVRNLN